MTFELKMHYEADKSNQLPPDQFSFNHLAQADTLAVSKNEIRVLVSRGRTTLAKAYRQMHGVEPDKSLLFQTKQSKGYRLNPQTRIHPSSGGR